MNINYLSENTRKIRRSLLLVSLIGYAISKVGLTLTEFQVFGSKFELKNYEAIPFVLIMVVAYFLTTFTVYALSEFAQGYKIAGEELVERHAQGKPTSALDIRLSMNKIRDEIRRLSDLDVDIDTLDSRDSAVREKQVEYDRLGGLHDMIMDFQSRIPLYARISWKSVRTLVEMALPVVVALYVIVHLAFYTEISNPNPESDAMGTDLNPPDSVVVVKEAPVAMDSTDSMFGD